MPTTEYPEIPVVFELRTVEFIQRQMEEWPLTTVWWCYDSDHSGPGQFYANGQRCVALKNLVEVPDPALTDPVKHFRGEARTARMSGQESTAVLQTWSMPKAAPFADVLKMTPEELAAANVITKSPWSNVVDLPTASEYIVPEAGFTAMLIVGVLGLTMVARRWRRKIQ